MVTYLTWLLHGNTYISKEPLYIRFVKYNVVDKNLMHQTASPQVFRQHVVKWEIQIYIKVTYITVIISVDYFNFIGSFIG